MELEARGFASLFAKQKVRNRLAFELSRLRMIVYGVVVSENQPMPGIGDTGGLLWRDGLFQSSDAAQEHIEKLEAQDQAEKEEHKKIHLPYMADASNSYMGDTPEDRYDYLYGRDWDLSYDIVEVEIH